MNDRHVSNYTAALALAPMNFFQSLALSDQRQQMPRVRCCVKALRTLGIGRGCLPEEVPMRVLSSMAIVLLSAGAAFAQSTPDAKPPNPPAVATPAPAKPAPNPAVVAPNPAVPAADNAAAAPPVPGANSFTEGQARSRIESMGFTNVIDLKLDDQSIWRGRATKDGKQVNVALDFKGNVVSQ